MKHISQEIVASEIRSGKTVTEIAAAMDVSRVTIQKRMKLWGITKKQIQFNENFFEAIDNEARADWRGFIMADGCVSTTHHPKVVIKISNRDGDHLQKWHDAIHSSLKLHRMKSGTQSQHYSEKMCQDLSKWGCTPRKSNNLRFPYINRLLIRHFIRGYFDGDGSAELRTHQKKPQLRLSFVGTEQFLTKLQEHLKTNNKLQPTGDNKVARQLQVSGNIKAKKIVEWMYRDATIFLERKKEICCADL